MIFLFLNKYTQLAKQKLVRKGWNQHQRRSAFSHFHTEPLPHFELPRWQEINSATTEWIYAERTTSSLHVSVILSGAAWKQPKSNRPGRMPGTPVIPPQQRSCLKRGATQHFIRVVCTIDSVCGCEWLHTHLGPSVSHAGSTAVKGRGWGAAGPPWWVELF